MSPNELRIGNIVSCNNEITKIHDVGTHGIDLAPSSQWFYCFNEDVIKPIVLNKERLIQCEFTNTGNDIFYIEIGRQGFIITKNPCGDFTLLHRHDIGLDFHILKFICHVHELQNIIFEITGEELNVNIK